MPESNNTPDDAVSGGTVLEGNIVSVVPIERVMQVQGMCPSYRGQGDCLEPRLLRSRLTVQTAAGETEVDLSLDSAFLQLWLAHLAPLRLTWSPPTWMFEADAEVLTIEDRDGALLYAFKQGVGGISLESSRIQLGSMTFQATEPFCDTHIDRSCDYVIGSYALEVRGDDGSPPYRLLPHESADISSLGVTYRVTHRYAGYQRTDARPASCAAQLHGRLRFELVRADALDPEAVVMATGVLP
ncbi:MAG: hypothetical protein AAFX99_12265 [Myxococcota bacterium]